MRVRQLPAALREHWVILAGLVAVAALVTAVDPQKVGRALEGSDLRAVAGMLAVVPLLYFSHGIAWSIALRGAGAPVGFRQAVRVAFISQAFTFLPGGDLWRVPIVRSEDSRPLEAGVITATVVFDDLVYFFVLTFAMIPAALRYPPLLAPFALAVLPQAVIFGILLWPSLYSRLADRVGRARLVRRFQPQLALLGPTFRRLVIPRVAIPVVLVDAASAAMAIALYALALSAVHASGAGLRQVAFTYSAGQVLSGLTVLPGALGAYEGMMTGMMAVQGVAAAAAAAAALLYRAVNDVLMAMIGLALAVLVDREILKGIRSRAVPVLP